MASGSPGCCEDPRDRISNLIQSRHRRLLKFAYQHWGDGGGGAGGVGGGGG